MIILLENITRFNEEADPILILRIMMSQQAHHIYAALDPAGTTNPGITRKLDNPLEGIWNPITRNPDKSLKGIRNIVPNRIRRQWPRGFTVPT